MLSSVTDAPSGSDHLVRFYEDDEALAAAVARFLADGLAAGDQLAVVATEAHVRAFRRHLEADGWDVGGACEAGELTFFDAHETLARFMRAGEPDRDLFHAEIGVPIARQAAAAAARGVRLRAYGEMVDLLWQRGERTAAIRLEELWNAVQADHSFSLLCAYAMGGFYKEPAAVHSVCEVHTHVVAERGGDGEEDGAGGGIVEELGAHDRGRQHTRALIREIARRAEVEQALRDSLRQLRRKEQALQRSERQLQSMTDALPVLVSLVDADGRYQFVNGAYERWFGLRKADIVGRPVEEVVGAAAYESIRPRLERALAGETVEYEAEMPYREGGTRLIQAACVPMLEDDGRVTGCVALVADVTERKRLHRENLEAGARAEQLYQFAKAVVSAERVEEVFEAALGAIEAALGTTRAAILVYDAAEVMRFRAWRGLSDDYRRAVEGHSPWARDATAPQPVLVPDVEADPNMASYLPLFRREGIGSLAFIPLVTRGRLIGKFMVYYGAPHAYSSNEVMLASAIANHLASVTARFAAVTRLEETIRYNELLAGVLAHDLKNPLGAMMTAAQLMLMRREGEGDRDAKPLSRILNSGQRMVRMIDQLLDLTRARAGGGIGVEPREANLADLCGQAIGELELAFPDWRIRREVTGDQDGCWDPDRLLQIVSNLVGNAGQHGDPSAGIDVKLDGRQADQVTVQVHNAGVIPEALLPHLFDPFRGTRQRERRDYSRGLGLGLFIVKEIVRAHGGAVEVASSPGAGTTFTVRLPRCVPRAAALEASP